MNETKPAPHLKKWRSHLVLFFMFLLFLGLISRAGYLQLIKKDFLQGKGASRYYREVTVYSRRGKIFDRNGVILAMSYPSKNVFANSLEANAINKEDRKKLSSLLKMPLPQLDERLDSGKRFVYLQKQIEKEVSDKISEMKLPGIYQENTFKRFYSTGNTMGNIVGLSNSEGEGLEGIEFSKNKILKGEHGKRSMIRDNKGNTVEERDSVDFRHGEDVHLTIDSNLQKLATDALKETVDEFSAKAASAIVIDAKTGEILALANIPNYDSNKKVKIGDELRNRAIVDSWEPGSIIKPLSVGIALDKGIISPNTVFDTRSVKIGSKEIKDVAPRDDQTVTQIIQRSSNIGTVKIAQRISSKDMWQTFVNLGFGQHPGTGFPGETKGLLRHHSKWRPIEHANMSFGHGMTTSLLQVARSYTVFTNKGSVLPLKLVKGVDEGESLPQVFKPSTVNRLNKMMYLTTQKGGTALAANTKDYSVAGKTGTANKVIGGKYVNKYVSSFVGFAPVSNPRVIVAVMVDEPQKAYYGGVVAAPLFSRITQSVLEHMAVPADIQPGKEEVPKEIKKTKAKN